MAESTRTSIRFAKHLEECPDPVFAVGSDRRIVFFNTACQRLLGWGQEEMMGRECRHHGPSRPDDPDDAAGGLCPPPAAFAGEITRTQTLVLCRSGERLWRTLHCWPLRRPGGGVAVVLGWLLESPESGGDGEPATLPEAFARLRDRLYRRFGFDHIVAQSPAMQRTLHQVRWAAACRIPVLLQGSTGTGRETLAQTIHYQSADRARGFMTLDCEVLPGDLIVKQLDDAGFFTRRGDGSRITVYFREPIHLPAELQARIAATADHTADAARLMAGTQCDLRQAADAGKFHQLLYHRLSVMTIEVPDLKNRREDVPYLVQQVIERYNAGNSRQIVSVAAEVIELLQNYSWPRNLLEFNSVVVEACERSAGGRLHVDDLPHRIRTAVGLGNLPPPALPRPLPLDAILERTERRLLEIALRDAKGNKSRAAERLGISRARLHRRLNFFGIADESEEIEPVIQLADDDPNPPHPADGSNSVAD